MCLEKLRKFSVETNIGYKVFKLDDDGETHYGADYGGTHNKCKEKPSSKWLNSKDYGSAKTLTTLTKQLYPAGFHVFLTEEDARAWRDLEPDRTDDVVRKVQFRGIVATGYQKGKVVVAGKMMILPGEPEVSNELHI